MSRIVVILPGAPILLAKYRSAVDQVHELRNACIAALASFDRAGFSEVGIFSEGGRESRASTVAESLLRDAGFDGEVVDLKSVDEAQAVVVVANGSACRSARAPGHLDSRAFKYDGHIEAALALGDAATLSELDVDLGSSLLAEGLAELRCVAGTAGSRISPEMLYAADPFGVRYWVATWICDS